MKLADEVYLMVGKVGVVVSLPYPLAVLIQGNVNLAAGRRQHLVGVVYREVAGSHVRLRWHYLSLRASLLA